MPARRLAVGRKRRLAASIASDGLPGPPFGPLLSSRLLRPITATSGAGYGPLCQTETGSAFAINALIEPERVETIEGSPEPVLTPSESGKGQLVWRCPECRIALWSNYGGTGDLIRFVRVGTLDEPARLPPDIHIYTRSKLPWVRLPDGVPAVESYYSSAKLWPAESLERRNRALGITR